MSDDLPYADIIILALIAGFILLRLRSVLGQKGKDNPELFHKPLIAVNKEPVVVLDEKAQKPKLKDESDPAFDALNDDAVKSSIQSIKAKDPQFSLTIFLQGAKRAFEMVFDAFKEGDKESLKRLLSDAIAQHFIAELDARIKNGNKSETTLVSATPKAVTHASTDGSLARLSVQFSSEQVTVVRDASNKIIEGDASAIHHAEDQWTFERDTASKNPNWKIIET